MKFSVILLSFTFLLTLSSCTTVRVSSDYDRNANFGEYKTFAFHQKGLDELKMNDLDKRRVTDAITAELQAKGMSPAQYETAADVIINLKASHRDRVDVNQTYDPWWGWGPGWGWGPDYRVNQYKEGTLVIDMVDRRKNILVWQGAGAGLNVSDLERKAERIPQAVKEILAKYPPKK